jgi:hypothetical protein
MNNDNFFSIDRLVEFGLGVGIAQQMVSSMNHVMANTQVPKVLGVGVSGGYQYFVVLNEKKAGPFNEVELSRLITDGKLNKDTFVWRHGMSNWDVPENIPDVLKLIALTPPPLPQKRS